jgi:hypothetical protein
MSGVGPIATVLYVLFQALAFIGLKFLGDAAFPNYTNIVLLAYGLAAWLSMSYNYYGLMADLMYNREELLQVLDKKKELK